VLSGEATHANFNRLEPTSTLTITPPMRFVPVGNIIILLECQNNDKKNKYNEEKNYIPFFFLL
jgi:hypothetical protein